MKLCQVNIVEKRDKLSTYSTCGTVAIISPLTRQQKLAVVHLKKTTGNLPNKVELAIGMKAMVVFNIGARRWSRQRFSWDIVLDPKEIVDDDTATSVFIYF